MLLYSIYNKQEEAVVYGLNWKLDETYFKYVILMKYFDFLWILDLTKRLCGNWPNQSFFPITLYSLCIPIRIINRVEGRWNAKNEFTEHNQYSSIKIRLEQVVFCVVLFSAKRTLHKELGGRGLLIYFFPSLSVFIFPLYTKVEWTRVNVLNYII